MTDMTDETIRVFGNRSNLVVLLIATGFALTPSVYGFFAGPGDFLAVFWIPLCFITIPPIHILCKRVQGLNARLLELEEAVNQATSAQ